MIELQEIFDISYGTNLELNSLILSDTGINFVSRTEKNNGVSARVEPLKEIKPIQAGAITVAGGGSVLSTFLQNEPFYSGRDLYYLISKITLSESEKLFYCACIRANKYRYNYGRQANKTLATLQVPSPGEIPEWVKNTDIHKYDNAKKSLSTSTIPNLNTDKWQYFEYQDLFEIKKGKRLTKADMKEGETVFIGSTDSNNGITNYVQTKANHSNNVITVNYNGSVAEAFYQPVPFAASDDVNILYPKFDCNQYIAMFLCTIIKKEKYRFNYGRKWHKGRMEVSKIKLPVDNKGNPDWQFMENYIKSLPYSSVI